MRVVIAGAGQIGSLVGAACIENGHDVELFDNSAELVETLNREGLVIERRDGRVDTYSVRASLEPGVTIGGPADIVLVQVKGFATRDVAERLRPIVDDRTLVLTLQNGLGNEAVLRELFGASRVLVGMTTHTVVSKSPGRYAHTGVREIWLGPCEGEDLGSATAVADAMRRHDFPVTVMNEHDIRVAQWGKFVANCAVLPVSALTRLPIDLLITQPTSYDLMDAIVRETCDIAAGQGVEFDPDERVAFFHDLLGRAGGRASMLGDVLAGRRTEIATINGAAVAFAEQTGIPAPLNRAMCALVTGLEAAMGAGHA